MPDSKYAEAVKKLTKKTDEGTVAWEAYDPSDEVDPPKSAERGYESRYKGKSLRIYKEITEEEVDEDRFIELDPDPDLLSTKPKTRRVERTVLKLQNPETGAEWTFPQMSILDDLHSSVRQEAAGVQEWMSDILDEDQD